MCESRRSRRLILKKSIGVFEREGEMRQKFLCKVEGNEW